MRDERERRPRRGVLRSVPEIFEPLGVAFLGLPATDTDHVKTFRPASNEQLTSGAMGSTSHAETYGRSMREVFARMAGVVDRFE
jgi:hypothetical protein